MDLSQKRQRWERSLVQATHFAETENTTDAVARARLILREVDQEIERATTAADREALDLFRKRVARRLTSLEEAHSEWKGRVVGRKDAFMDREQEAYDEPIKGTK